MNLGSVVRKEREKRKLGIDEMVARMGEISRDEYEELEGGRSPLEEYGLLLAGLAMQLEVPMSRLIDEAGPYGAPKAGSCAGLIRAARAAKGLAVDELAAQLHISAERYRQMESGDEALERWAPRLLRCAQVIEQPIFNFVYPCGLPHDSLHDYP